MNITITIPDPKFQVGDVVRYTKSDDVEGFVVIGKIEAISGRGEWQLLGNAVVPVAYIDEYYYHITCQEGCLTTGNTPIRPGTFMCPRVEKLNEVGEKIDYIGKVWTPDTQENIGERWKKERRGTL